MGGSTENKTVCQAPLNNLIERGLDPEHPILAVIDGGKAIRAALKATFGERVLIARCRQHKWRYVLDHLPEAQRTFIGRRLDRAWRETDPEELIEPGTEAFAAGYSSSRGHRAPPETGKVPGSLLPASLLHQPRGRDPRWIEAWLPG